MAGWDLSHIAILWRYCVVVESLCTSLTTRLVASHGWYTRAIGCYLFLLHRQDIKTLSCACAKLLSPLDWPPLYIVSPTDVSVLYMGTLRFSTLILFQLVQLPMWTRIKWCLRLRGVISRQYENEYCYWLGSWGLRVTRIISKQLIFRRS